MFFFLFVTICRKRQGYGCELTFRDISVKIEKKYILKNVSGLAKPGEMMAIMGPSGKKLIIVSDSVFRFLWEKFEVNL